MRRIGLAAIAVAVTALAGAGPVHAQTWRADIGVNGGASWYSRMLSSDAWNGTDGVAFKGTWLTGAQLGFWFTPRIGIRANGTYTDAQLQQGSGFFSKRNTLYGDVNLWSATGDLMFRFKQPAATMTHMEMLPYLALGLGEKFINPAANNYNVNLPDGTQKSGVPFVCATGFVPPNGASGECVGPATGVGTNYFLTQTSRLMGLVGLGTDMRLARNFALRLEIGDRLYKPQIVALNGLTAPSGTVVFDPALSTASSADNVSKLVNEVYAQVGLHMLLGIAAPPVVAVTPTPAPEPPPPPPPPPPAAPATQNVSVCVVTPTAPAGLTSETAVYNPATGDTTIVVNGTATPLRSAFTGVTTASGATWYVQGQPLVLGTGKGALNYVSFGTPRNVDIGDLTYVGTVNGLPVYANRSDVTSLTIPNPPTEITGNTQLLTGLRKVQVLYVPLTSYGCNFQPIQLQQAVRKVRG